MSEQPLAVGEIGILQNITLKPSSNGTLAEVLGELKFRELVDGRGSSHGGIRYLVKIFTVNPPMGPNGVGWTLRRHEIRRITDPDQEQTTEHKEAMPVAVGHV